jgi:hypothetical protein
MPNLLDERIHGRGKHRLEMRTQDSAPLFHEAQYQGIVNTIVQLVRLSAFGVIYPSHPLLSRDPKALLAEAK